MLRNNLDKALGKATVLASLLAFSNLTIAADFEEAIEDTSYLEYQKASSLMMDTDISGNPQAQFELALIFHSGSKGYVDINHAQILYNLSAENGYRPAQKYLSAAYSDGAFGFEKNPQLATYWNNLYKNQTTPY